ncbi:MAG: type II toxin-antitoxin system VapC family toxin [Deltaproteobacteria bacterium]|nr:type II toxin-antitoxin system VapC family toxin [Deltaproteobacteria bacterium]
MFLFDSDVLIDFLRGAEPVAKRVAFELEHANVAVSAVTAFELTAGAVSVRQRAAVETLLEATPIVPVSADVAMLAGKIFRELKAAGQEIGMADCLIGATCVAQRLLLVTRNRKHFERIPGIKLTIMAADGRL